METTSTDLLRSGNCQLLFNAYEDQLRAAKALPDESRQALAKLFLTDFAERLPERCANISIADKYERIRISSNVHHKAELISFRFLPFEKAMKNEDYLLALHDLKDTVYFLPTWHELIYNNLARIFNKYLNTNLQPMEINMEHLILSPAARAGSLLCDGDSEARKYLKGVLSTLDGITHRADNDKEVLAAYDFYITFMREELRIGMIGDYIHDKAKNNSDKPACLFPDEYTINGKLADTKTKDYTGAPIQINDTCLVSSVWDGARIPEAYLDVKENRFIFDDGNCYSIFFPEINLCYVANGFHHASVASLLRTGNITPQKTCSLAQFYPYVYSDGVYWLSVESNEIICKAQDFRIAAIYELSRKRQEILEACNQS